MPNQLHPDVDLPRVAPVLFRAFHWYARRYFRRHFHALRIARGALPIPDSDAVVCYANHPGWWDPLLAIVLNQSLLGGRNFFAPIDAVGLAKYRFFSRLGFYGIDLATSKGARRFLSVTRALLGRPDSAVWLTPSGKFQDVRQRTTCEPGLSHLAATCQPVTFQPVAVEYVFWEERTPEALIELGQPLPSRVSQSRSKAEWQALLEQRLAEAQQRLAEKSVARNAESFDVLIQGSAGVGGIYDGLRRVRAHLLGQTFHPRHGNPHQPEPSP